jgi:hypothetical protein
MAVQTISLFDIIVDSGGAPQANVTVTLSFGYNAATDADGLILPSQRTATTDGTGKWTIAKVIPNDLIAPSNTIYLVETPFRTYEVAPQSTNGASQQSTAANVIVNNPLGLAPYTGLIGGAVTFTGLLTAQAGEVISGGTGATLTAAGALAVGSLTVSTGSGPYTPQGIAGNVNGLLLDSGGAVINVQHPKYRAIGTWDPVAGTGDAAASIQQAMTDVSAAGGILFVPPGQYRIIGSGTEIFLRTKPIQILGTGYASNFVVDATVPGTRDVFRFAPALASDGYQWKVQDISISVASGTPGRYGFNLDTTTAGVILEELLIDHCWVGTLGSYAIQGTNPTNANGGVFSMVISNNILSRGIRLTNLGDTITIIDNVISGTTAGVEVDLVASAQSCRIENNNITSNAGGVVVKGGSSVSVIVAFNEVEQQAAYTEANNAMIDLDGAVAKRINNAVIFGNIVTGTGAGISAIRVNYADDTFIAGNRLAAISTGSHVLITANAIATHVAGGNAAYGTGVGVSDSGTGTYGYANFGTGNRQLLSGGGAVGSPDYSFSSAKTTGMYLPVGGVLGFTSAGADAARIDSSGVRLVDGGATAPSLNFINEIGTGLSRILPSVMAASISGVERARFTATGLVVTGDQSYSGHLLSTASGAPATSNLGANVTSVTFTGNDTRGTIAIVMAGILAANTRVATCTFAASYGATGPKIALVNQTSGVGLGIVNFYVLAQSTGVSFDIAVNQALALGTYTVDYIVIG